MKAQLELFLANVPGLLELEDFLPKQAGAEARFNLCDHQQDALDWLALIRTEGKTIVCAQPMPAAVVAEYLGAVEPEAGIGLIGEGLAKGWHWSSSEGPALALGIVFAGVRDAGASALATTLERGSQQVSCS